MGICDSSEISGMSLAAEFWIELSATMEGEREGCSSQSKRLPNMTQGFGQGVCEESVSLVTL